MGHTHSYEILSEISKPAWNRFLTDAQKIIEQSGIALTGDEDNPQAPPILNENEIEFNGIGENGCEVFRLFPTPKYFFCKTNLRNYDLVVTAVLVAAKHHFGKKIRVSSDGEPLEWEAGLRLARSALGYGDFPFNENTIRDRFNDEYVPGFIEDYRRIRSELGIS